MLETDRVVVASPRGGRADRASTDESGGQAARLSVLHVVVKAGATNSQYNEHCLPVARERRITLCSLFPATVSVRADLSLVQGDGSLLGCFRALRRALALGRYDVVHVHAVGSGVLTLAAYLVERRSRGDLVFTLHTSWPNVRPRNRFLMYVVAAMFPVVVACGDASARSLPRSLRLLTRRLEVVPNGVDVERVDRAGPVTEPGATEECLVASVGRLIPVKDPATVVAAFTRAAGAGDRLVMLGEGELEGGLRDVEGVTIAGPVPRDEVYGVLHRAEVFVSASRVEGLPVAVLEAMACRCLLVLSDIPAHREIARAVPSAPAYLALVEPGDVSGFAAAIRRLSQLPRSERQRGGEELRRCAVEHFSVRRMTEEYGRVYEQVVMAARARERRRAGRHRSMRGAADPALARRLAYAAACGLVGAGAAFAYGNLHPASYDADVTLAVGEEPATADAELVADRSLSAADLAGLVDRQPVLERVAQGLGVHEWRSLRARVVARALDEDPTEFVVTASATSPAGAERLAGAVAGTLVAMTTDGADRAHDPGFVADQLERIPLEIDAEQTHLQTLERTTSSAGEPERRRTVAALRLALADLHAGYEGMLEWRADSRGTHGLRVVERGSGRAAPPLPAPAVLAVAGGAAGSCLWVAGWLLLRRPDGAAR